MPERIWSNPDRPISIDESGQLMTPHYCLLALFGLLMPIVADGIDYPYSSAEPQKSGWPLTDEERAYVVDKAEHDRRPGREANKH